LCSFVPTDKSDSAPLPKFTVKQRVVEPIWPRAPRKGDRVALVIPDSDEFVLSFLGAIYAGVVPVPMYPQLSFKNVESYHDTVAHITRASGASMLLTTASTRPFVRAR